MIHSPESFSKFLISLGKEKIAPKISLMLSFLMFVSGSEDHPPVSWAGAGAAPQPSPC